jgi:ribosomal protein L37E
MAIAGEERIDHVQRCKKCGRRSVSAGACSACGEPSAALTVVSRLGRSPQQRNVHAQHLVVPHAAFSTAPLIPVPVATVRPLAWNHQRGAGRVRGRVIIVKSSANEPMDFDPWRWIALPSWGLIILISPIIGAIIAWQSVGFIGAAAVALTTFLVLRFMFSNRLLQSWYFVSALNGRNVVEVMPVIMIRVRQADDREIQLRLKGQLQGGTVIEGDRISAVGRWTRGVFYVRQVFCERTGATIVPKQPTARTWAIVGLGILVSTGLWLHFLGAPWVAQRTRSLQAAPIVNRIHEFGGH